MKVRFDKVFIAAFLAVYISSIALSSVVLARPVEAKEALVLVNHEPKKGINPETGIVSFIANVYGKEFGLKNPSQELKLQKLDKDNSGNDIARYQQLYRGVPVIAGEMIVNMNSNGELLSISGEVSPDLVLDTKPRIKAQEALKVALY